MKKIAFFLTVVALCLLVSMDAMAQRRGGRRHGGGHNRSDARSAPRSYAQPAPRSAPRSNVRSAPHSTPRSYAQPAPRSTPRSNVRSAPRSAPRSNVRSAPRSAPRSYVRPAPRSQTEEIRRRANQQHYKSWPYKSYYNTYPYSKSYWKNPPVVYTPRYKPVRPTHRSYQPPRYRHRHYYYGWEPNWWAWSNAWDVGYAWWYWNTPETYAYYNPYVIYVKELPYNYSTPVVIVKEAAAAPQVPQAEAVPAVEVPEVIAAPKPVEGLAEAVEAPKAAETMKHFKTAQAEFQKGNYNATKKELDQAIAKAPQDATLHEFLGLTLFAQGKYNQAAGVINAVIASGPGWDWDTMINFYSDPELYTNQLRDIELHVRQNKTDAAARFLLAYHYLVMDFVDNAEQQFKEVIKLQPKDVLSKRLLEMIEKSKKASGEPATPKRPTPQK